MARFCHGGNEPGGEIRITSDNPSLIPTTTPAMLDQPCSATSPPTSLNACAPAAASELDVSALEALEADRKRIQVRTQELQSLRNSRSKAIGQAKAKGEDVSAIMAEVAAFADELKASEVALDELRERSKRSRWASRTCRPMTCRPVPMRATTSSRRAGVPRQFDFRCWTTLNWAPATAGWTARPRPSCPVRASPCCAARSRLHRALAQFMRRPAYRRARL